MKSYQSEHFCLLVHAQDHWDEKDESQILQEVIQNYSQLHGHSDCKICLTCSICQSLWSLFDPTYPGEYNAGCNACEDIYQIFSKKRGNNSGLILFSHDNLKREKLLSLTDVLLEQERIKKIIMLQLEYQKITNRTFEIIDALETKKVTKFEFNELFDKNDYQLNVNYEISKDRYF
jgi:hypothetical protein